MVTLLITSFFILLFLAVAIYFWQKPSLSQTTEPLLPEYERRSLFPIDAEENDNESSDSQKEDERNAILERAQAGQLSTLTDASNLKDKQLYEYVLNLLVSEAEGAQLLALASYISRHDLQVNTALAEKLIASAPNTLNRNTTAKLLHVAALSNDAKTYSAAVERLMERWKTGAVLDVSPQELRAMIDGEFWVLSSNARSSGAGFILKRTLADARKQLAREHSRDLSTRSN